MNKDRNLSKIFIAKSSRITIFFSYIILILAISLTGYVLYSDVYISNIGFKTVISKRFFDGILWVLPLGSLIFLLNTKFRSVEFLDNMIVEKRWYWKNKYFLYSELQEVKTDLEDGNNKLVLVFKDSSKLKVPAYLLSYNIENGAIGENLIEFLKSKTSNSIKIE